METKFLELKKIRDFGEILNATFIFLKQNVKPLFKALITYAGPFILLSAIATGYYQSNALNTTLLTLNPGMNSLISYFEDIMLSLLLLIVASSLSYTMIITTVYSYMKLYVMHGKEGIVSEDLGRLIGKNFFRVFGTSIVIFLAIMIGMIFCFVPGIYLGVSLCLIFPIMIFEDISFSNAFSRSFKLTHYQWWWTLLILIVIYLIVAVVGYIIAIPQMIISFVYGFNSVAKSANPIEGIKDIMLVVTVFMTFINSLLGVIPFVTIALQYFNIVEKKENPALLNRINQME